MKKGKVVLSDPFKWQKYFFNKDDSKKEVKDYFVWGANSYNYNYRRGKILGYTDKLTGEKKNGSGMAGPKGPTRGKAHPNYVGIVSIYKPGDNLDEIFEINKKQFRKLFNKLKGGHNVIFPMNDNEIPLPKKITLEFIKENHGLGKGVALKRVMESKDKKQLKLWQSIQDNIKENIDTLLI